jgi:hypothetical protein
MANTFVTPNLIASSGIETLYNTIVLAGLVWRDFDSDFTGKQGDTITVRKPAVLEASDFDQEARTTSYQDATEDSVDVTLDHLSHVPFHVTDEQTTLEISAYEAQLLNPAMEALAQKVDGELAEGLADAASGESQLVSLSDDKREPPEGNYVFRGARALLGRQKLPLLDRYVVVSPEAAAEVLGDKTLLEADKSGSTEALRNAIMGRLLAFETYESQVFGLGGGDKGVADGVAFHKTAITLATRPLSKPRGVAQENIATQSYKGLSLRVIYSYDHDAKMDKVTVDMLYGIAETRPEGAVELDFGQGS